MMVAVGSLLKFIMFWTVPGAVASSAYACAASGTQADAKAGEAVGSLGGLHVAGTPCHPSSDPAKVDRAEFNLDGEESIAQVRLESNGSASCFCTDTTKYRWH